MIIYSIDDEKLTPIKKVKFKSEKDLQALTEKNLEELFNLKFQAALGNIEKPARIGEIKRTIARMKTVITEKENASKVSK